MNIINARKLKLLLIIQGILLSVPTYSSAVDEHMDTPTRMNYETVFSLKDECETAFDLVSGPNEACFQRLDTYFLAQPIWSYANVRYNFGQQGMFHKAILNKRNRHLRFSTYDVNASDVPLGSDIFDMDVQYTEQIVAGVFSDLKCRALYDQGPINSTLYERCHARSLFKYATYIDVCLTGISRWKFLNERGLIDKSSYYDHSIAMFKEFYPIKSQQLITKLIENNLNSAWIAKKCDPFQVTVFNDKLENTYTMNFLPSYDLEETSRFLQKGFNAAISISARSGDNWAIQNYLPPMFSEDPSFWSSLYRLNPILSHRWFASLYFSRSLNSNDRVQHAIVSYLLIQKSNSLGKVMQFEDYLRNFSFRVDERDQAIKNFNQIKNSNEASIDDIAHRLGLPWNHVE